MYIYIFQRLSNKKTTDLKLKELKISLSLSLYIYIYIYKKDILRYFVLLTAKYVHIYV